MQEAVQLIMSTNTRQIVLECGRLLGYPDMKDKQIEAAVAFLNGSDVFVSLPTGYGKSLIYAILPLAFDKLKGKIAFEPLTIL